LQPSWSSWEWTTDGKSEQLAEHPRVSPRMGQGRASPALVPMWAAAFVPGAGARPPPGPHIPSDRDPPNDPYFLAALLLSPGRQEIWQLWAKLRKDEPQLLGNLEDFLAKMRHRIQEARSKKEALEEALNK